MKLKGREFKSGGVVMRGKGWRGEGRIRKKFTMKRYKYGGGGEFRGDG